MLKIRTSGSMSRGGNGASERQALQRIPALSRITNACYGGGVAPLMYQNGDNGWSSNEKGRRAGPNGAETVT